MNTTTKVLIVIIVLAILGGGGYFVWKKYFKKTSSATSKTTPASTKLFIPQNILENKFGFLSGGPESFSQIKDYGAAWVRPHPGPFLWDRMQKETNAEINFDATDKLVKEIQENQLGTLATLWPFADWDQKTRPNADNCPVSSNDEFLPKNDIKGRVDYLPQYRCNPNDWTQYQTWVKAVIERYDGDGISDMPGLEIPIKYWEVMNEPDLDSPDGRLDFYKEDANAYAELLIKTSTAIRQADPAAKILIAGAAGGQENFLNFYQEVFKNKETQNAFDIGNVHCISNDTGNDFNVSSYKKILEEAGISKPIWVTEAENMKGNSLEANAALTRQSSQGAVSAGAERIFYTRYNFGDFRKDMSEKPKESAESMTKSQEIYKDIIDGIK